MMASKARLFGDDSALSAILATDDLREEQKCIGRQIRHFNHESWQQKQKCENIVLQTTRCAWPLCTPANAASPKQAPMTICEASV
ncbi:unnamed protein product [Ascophyllum nodosum]